MCVSVVVSRLVCLYVLMAVPVSECIVGHMRRRIHVSVSAYIVCHMRRRIHVSVSACIVGHV
jgi:hypothetical protein